MDLLSVLRKKQGAKRKAGQLTEKAVVLMSVTLSQDAMEVLLLSTFAASMQLAGDSKPLQ